MLFTIVKRTLLILLVGVVVIFAFAFIFSIGDPRPFMFYLTVAAKLVGVISVGILLAWLVLAGFLFLFNKYW